MSIQEKMVRLAKVQGYLFGKALRPGFHPLTESMHEDVETLLIHCQKKGGVWDFACEAAWSNAESFATSLPRE